MKLTDIPDYRNKKLRLASWIPLAYVMYKDGEWWHNYFDCADMSLHFAPGKDIEKDRFFSTHEHWEEYVEWKANVLEEFHQLNLKVTEKMNEIQTLMWAFKDKVEKLSNCTKDQYEYSKPSQRCIR